jgi:hypothetical protein
MAIVSNDAPTPDLMLISERVQFPPQVAIGERMRQTLMHPGKQSAPPLLAPVFDAIEQMLIVAEEIDLTTLPEGLEALYDGVEFHLAFGGLRGTASGEAGHRIHEGDEGR